MLLPDGFDPVDELYTGDQLGQLVVSVEAAPAFLGGLGELEDHGERGLLDRHPFVRTVRWRTVANVLSMGLLVLKCFQCSAGKS